MFILVAICLWLWWTVFDRRVDIWLVAALKRWIYWRKTAEIDEFLLSSNKRIDSFALCAIKIPYFHHWFQSVLWELMIICIGRGNERIFHCYVCERFPLYFWILICSARAWWIRFVNLRFGNSLNYWIWPIYERMFGWTVLNFNLMNSIDSIKKRPRGHNGCVFVLFLAVFWSRLNKSWVHLKLRHFCLHLQSKNSSSIDQIVPVGAGQSVVFSIVNWVVPIKNSKLWRRKKKQI